MTWIIAAASLTGVILNIKKQRACFVIWCATNAAWVVVDFRAGLYAQAALFFIYFLLAVWGLIEWSRNPIRKDEK